MAGEAQAAVSLCPLYLPAALRPSVPSRLPVLLRLLFNPLLLPLVQLCLVKITAPYKDFPLQLVHMMPLFYPASLFSLILLLTLCVCTHIISSVGLQMQGVAQAEGDSEQKFIEGSLVEAPSPAHNEPQTPMDADKTAIYRYCPHPLSNALCLSIGSLCHLRSSDEWGLITSGSVQASVSGLSSSTLSHPIYLPQTICKK